VAFKKRPPTKAVAPSPEAMLQDIRTKKIPGPMASQADVWREYVEKHLNSSDVAIRMPTGAGKTLVGIALAEWRRRKFKEKIVYLCPTNQLVNQVAEQAKMDYGIDVIPFVGKKSEYDPSYKAEYKRVNKIAVTSYSALFNSNPYFDDADILILDDAHAAENYIGSMWSLNIESEGQLNGIFKSLIAILENAASNLGIERRIKYATNQEVWVEKIPTGNFFSAIISIQELLDSELNSTSSSSAYHSWRALRTNLHACHCYVSPTNILFRPLIPPTFSHSAFSLPKQRIYMSATLGSGGDLERMTGRKNIKRISIDSIDSTEIGRRFFLFPEVAFLPDEVEQLIKESLKLFGRGVFITPSSRSAESRKENLSKIANLEILGVEAISVSKTNFLEHSNAALVMANRYDGVDFPHDQCRLLVLEGLPKSQNMQEKFLLTKMGCTSLFADRIKTRITQAFGRCTRANSDFAAVIILGDEWMDYLLEPNNRNLLHPEIQAELIFGDEQSKTSLDDVLENLEVFLGQQDDWQEVADDILEIRNECMQLIPDEYEELSNSVSSEIEYIEAMWFRDYNKAFNASREVITCITNRKLRGYRALWNYLAGSAIEAAKNAGQALTDDNISAITFFEQAQDATKAIIWLAELSKTKRGSIDKTDSDINVVSRMVEQIESNLVNLGLKTNKKFTSHCNEILSGLSQTESKKYERVQVMLGNLLGFTSGNAEYQAAPDPWWVICRDLCIVFEDHSGAKNQILSVEKARQVCCHDNWVKEHVSGISDNAEIIKVLVTPTTNVATGGELHLSDVYILTPDEFYTWAKNVVNTITDIRSTLHSEGDFVWKSRANEILENKGLTPSKIKSFFKSKLAKNILTTQ
jgi:hypothetical protein